MGLDIKKYNYPSRISESAIVDETIARQLFSSPCVLEDSEIPGFLFAGFFGYFSSLNFEPLFCLIFSPYFSIVSIGFLMFLPFIWVIYLSRGEKKSKKALFKSSKKNGQT